MGIGSIGRSAGAVTAATQVPSTTPTTSTGKFIPGTGASSGLVGIGNGRNIYLECKGTGSPTVVFISGRSDRATIWQTLANPNQSGPAVFPGTATVTRACAYDRPGTVTITGNQVEASRSTPVP